MQRFFSSSHLLAACSLTAIFLGTLANPARADTTGFLSLINSYRQQNGAGTLVEDQNLTNSSCWFADDMGAKNYFPYDHVDSQGRTMNKRLTDFGVSGSRSENIFYTTSGSSANYAFDAWKGSSGHNTNMLGSAYTRIGIGRANYNGRWYWVTDFANGSATTMTNQCGQLAVQQPLPPAPPPTVKKTTPPPATMPAFPPPRRRVRVDEESPSPRNAARARCPTPAAAKAASRRASGNSR